MKGVAYTVCRSCGSAAFPPRPLCAVCGHGSWRAERALDGTLEDATTLRRAPGGLSEGAVILGTVRLDAGPALIARLDYPLKRGSRVYLRTEREAIHAGAER